MPNPVFSAGGRITPPAQTMLAWLVRNIHQAAANTDALDDPHYGTAVGDFASKVINGGVTLDKYAASEPAKMSTLWSLYQLYGPNDIEAQPTAPEPAVPPQTQAAQESIQGEFMPLTEGDDITLSATPPESDLAAWLRKKLEELEQVYNQSPKTRKREVSKVNEPMPAEISERLIYGSELSALGWGVVRTLDMLALEGRYPTDPAAKMYYDYCRGINWRRASTTPTEFFKQFPDTTRRLLECVRALDISA